MRYLSTITTSMPGFVLGLIWALHPLSFRIWAPALCAGGIVGLIFEGLIARTIGCARRNVCPGWFVRHFGWALSGRPSLLVMVVATVLFGWLIASVGIDAARPYLGAAAAAAAVAFSFVGWYVWRFERKHDCDVYIVPAGFEFFDRQSHDE